MTDMQYLNNISSDSLFDFDDLFSSTFPFLQHDPVTFNEDLSPEIVSDISDSPIESPLANLVCGVCGAPAHGYNFDQITCESCKAFFRRNALRHMPDLKCRFSGSCVISIQTRRQCTHCRLKKCFDIKMRKDWIRTDEERELRQLQKYAKEQKKLNRFSDDQHPLLRLPIVVRKKKRLLVKPIFSHTFFGFNRHLSDEDQIILNNIINTYQSNVIETVNISTKSTETLVEFIDEESSKHVLLINFYKSIPQFKQLNLDDQVLLLKSNLIKIVHLHCILIQQFQESPSIGSYMSRWISKDFHQRMSRTRHYFDRFIEHPLILKLALIVLIFSMNLSTSNDMSSFNNYNNRKSIFSTQEFYSNILWRYLNIIYTEREAIRSMEIIITQILHYQTLMDVMEELIRQTTDGHTFNQLESSLFRLT